jgi:hypothetical protein
LLVAHLPTLHVSPERKTGGLRQVGEWSEVVQVAVTSNNLNPQVMVTDGDDVSVE